MAPRNKLTPVLSIHGSLVMVKRGNKVAVRKLVSPEWLRLFMKIKEGSFDDSLWNALPRDLRSMMGSVCRLMGVPFNDDLNIALATDFKSDYDRLKLLEGNIQAGNNNKALYDECIEIIDRLTKSGQLSPQLGATIKAQLSNSRAILA